jgi:hypothetical protein
MEPHDALPKPNNSILLNGPCQDRPVFDVLNLTPTELQIGPTIAAESTAERDWAAGKFDLFDRWLA